MSHRPSGLAAEPRGDQFIVAPYRAVEKYQGRAVDTPLQVVPRLGAGGQKIEMLAGGFVADPKPERVARTLLSGRVGFSLQIPGRLSRHRERQHFETRRRTVRQRGLKGLVDRDRLA